MFVPGAIYLGLYSPWSKETPWSPIVLIWGWGLVVEVIRCVLIWIILVRTDWDRQVFLAKERSEAAKTEDHTDDIDDDDNRDEDVHRVDIRTSPKTRALIGDIESEEDRVKRLTACSLHEIPDQQDRDYRPLD